MCTFKFILKCFRNNLACVDSAELTLHSEPSQTSLACLEESGE